MTDVTIYDANHAPLPVNYEAAKQALAECVRVDECKEWRDRAAAIASYARQKRDRTLFEKAERIKVRATRRFGELMNEAIQSQQITVKQATKVFGVSPPETHTARAVARVKQAVFERKVEASPPASVTLLAKLGMNPRGEDESGPIWQLAQRLRHLPREFRIADVTQSMHGLTEDQKIALQHALRPFSELWDSVLQRIDL